MTPHEIHRNRTDKAPFSSNRVLGSVWNTNRETDRSTVCTQWSSWYCLISWSMHEWFGFDVQCCCIDHFLKTHIFSHVWQAAAQILRFLCVEPVVEFDWNLLFIFISALVIFLTRIIHFSINKQKSQSTDREVSWGCTCITTAPEDSQQQEQTEKEREVIGALVW